MSVPRGLTIIKSAAFANRVVDLSRARVNDPLIGFSQSNSPNQRWRFGLIGDNEFTIQTTTEAGGVAFAHTDVASGAVLVGRDNLIGIFEPELLPGGSFRICPKDNRQLSWTLVSGIEGTNIILRPTIENSANQAWVLLPAQT